MWTETPVFLEDLEYLADCDYIPWERLKGKTVFVTGATGLIGYTLTSALLHYEQKHHIGLRVLALVRNVEQGKQKFSKQLAQGCPLEFLEGRVEDPLQYEGEVDYVIHGACPTTSNFFVQQPVETIGAIVTGTRNVLEFAREKKVSGFVYLSSMEVYGKVDAKEKLKEEELGTIDLFSPRSSYPEGKRLAEVLCCAYACQHKLPVTVARLAQTFGPGVPREDERVFAYMARCAMEKEDIRLKTSGSKENMYLYTADAAGAVLLLLLKGERDAAYNVGDPATYCSVKEMGELVAREVAKGKISVVTNVGGAAGLYRPEGFLCLDVEKIEALGWKGERPLRQLYERMMECF